jgi:hypothetical protein
MVSKDFFARGRGRWSQEAWVTIVVDTILGKLGCETNTRYPEYCFIWPWCSPSFRPLSGAFDAQRTNQLMPSTPDSFHLSIAFELLQVSRSPASR